MSTKTVKLSIEGMSCQGCVKSVERILTKQPGVEQIEHVELGLATFTYEEEKQSLDTILEALDRAKFPARHAS